MLLTFHTDFSNEENGTIVFYKGFLAYYHAVGEWPEGSLILASAMLNGGRKKKILNSKEPKALFFLSQELHVEEACRPGLCSRREIPRKH